MVAVSDAAMSAKRSIELRMVQASCCNSVLSLPTLALCYLDLQPWCYLYVQVLGVDDIVAHKSHLTL